MKTIGRKPVDENAPAVGWLYLMYVFLSEKAIIVIAMGLWIIQKGFFRWELNEEMSAEERRDYEHGRSNLRINFTA